MVILVNFRNVLLTFTLPNCDITDWINIEKKVKKKIYYKIRIRNSLIF